MSEILQVGKKICKSEALVYYSTHVHGMLLTYGGNQTMTDK